MPDDTMLPEDDRDLSMARRLGAMLDQRTPLTSGDETTDDASIERALSAYKKAQQDTRHVPPAETTARIWNALEQRVREDQTRHSTRPRQAFFHLLASSRSSQVWLAAASIILLVAVGWLLWNRVPPPVLLASADQAIVTYTTPDGSVIRLRPHSQLYAIDERTASYRLVGEGFFAVTKNDTRTFTVEAGAGRIAVLGTRFNVSTWGRQTAVYLEEGRVRFEQIDSKQAVMLTPGEQSIITADGQLVAPTPVDSTEYLDWLHRELRFDRYPLRRVLDELGHHYAVAFEVPAVLQDEIVSGRILLDEVDQSLDDLGIILNGRFAEVNDSTYRFIQQ